MAQNVYIPYFAHHTAKFPLAFTEPWSCLVLILSHMGVTRCAVKDGQGQKMFTKNFHFGTSQTNFSGFKKWQAKEKRKKERKKEK